MNIELKDKNGITLKTAGKYCSSDVGIIPKLQSKSVATNGSVVADEGYCGLDSVTVDVPATPTQEKTVDLAMASGNQVISPDAGKNLSKVTVTKPSTLVAGNIKTGVSIGGVTGTLEAKKEEEAKTVDLAMASGNQTITPTSGKVLSQVVVKKPATMLPENIKENVNIGGIVGTFKEGEQPQLHSPDLNLSTDGVLTITSPSTNGDFVEKFKIYSNGSLLSEQTSNIIDLSTSITESEGNFLITVKCCGSNFKDSTESEITYVKIEIDPVFENNSWGKIAQIFKSGAATNYWNVGDTKTITSKSGKQYTIRIADMQTGRYAYADGRGNSHGVFEFVQCINLNGTTGFSATSSEENKGANYGGFALGDLHRYYLPKILADLPDDMQAAIGEVNVLSGTGYGTTSGTSSSANKLFVPAEMEVFDAKHNSIGLEECPLGQFDYYKTHNDYKYRTKYIVGTSSAKKWWFRSPASGSTSEYSIVWDNGNYSTSIANTSTIGVAPIFAI